MTTAADPVAGLSPRERAYHDLGRIVRRLDRVRRACILAVASPDPRRSRAACADLAHAVESLASELIACAGRLRALAAGGGA